jgi:hypothetical protein
MDGRVKPGHDVEGLVQSNWKQSNSIRVAFVFGLRSHVPVPRLIGRRCGL